mmetsp:Transcript_7946/g.17072  ORF Transcript_7946/g.17072 Transcript_7946/m.17072 type:complete len:242 (-) Transcript_7946:170-895(-)
MEWRIMCNIVRCSFLAVKSLHLHHNSLSQATIGVLGRRQPGSIETNRAILFVICCLVCHLNRREKATEENTACIFASFAILFGNAIFGSNCRPEFDHNNQSVQSEQAGNCCGKVMAPSLTFIVWNHSHLVIIVFLGYCEGAVEDCIDKIVADYNCTNNAKGFLVFLGCGWVPRPCHLHASEQLSHKDSRSEPSTAQGWMATPILEASKQSRLPASAVRCRPINRCGPRDWRCLRYEIFGFL